MFFGALSEHILIFTLLVNGTGIVSSGHTKSMHLKLDGMGLALEMTKQRK